KTQLATGELLTVDNQIDPTTGTVRLKAVFPNQDGRLYPNQFVNLRLQLDTLRGVVLVQAAAIQRSPQTTYVYVVKPDQTVSMRPVEVQRTEGDTTALQKGVAPGEMVVIDGVDRLHEGSKVAVRQPGQRPPEEEPQSEREKPGKRDRSKTSAPSPGAGVREGSSPRFTSAPAAAAGRVLAKRAAGGPG